MKPSIERSTRGRSTVRYPTNVTEKNATTNDGSDEKTPLLLDGIADDDVTIDFLRRIHEAADSEGSR